MLHEAADVYALLRCPPAAGFGFVHWYSRPTAVRDHGWRNTTLPQPAIEIVQVRPVSLLTLTLTLTLIVQVCAVSPKKADLVLRAVDGAEFTVNLFDAADHDAEAEQVTLEEAPFQEDDHESTPQNATNSAEALHDGHEDADEDHEDHEVANGGGGHDHPHDHDGEEWQARFVGRVELEAMYDIRTEDAGDVLTPLDEASAIEASQIFDEKHDGDSEKATQCLGTNLQA